jgi:hypothetical protein
MEEIPSENPFTNPGPALPARSGKGKAGAGGAASAPRPGSRRGSARIAEPTAPPEEYGSSSSSSSSYPSPPSLGAEYETRDASLPDVEGGERGGGGGLPTASTFASALPPTPKRTLCSSMVAGCGRVSNRIAGSRGGSTVFLLVVALTSLGLFGLSCNLLDTNSPFTQHMVNWRIPLAFFSSLIAATSVGNILLIQLRSLALMSMSLVVCGGLFFYCLVIDGPAAQKRAEYCASLPAATSAASPVCKVASFNAVVVLDFVLIPLLIYGGVIAWLHRRITNKRFPASSSAPSRGAGAARAGGGEGETGEAPEVNVFK